MPREYEDYRPLLAELRQRYPDNDFIRVQEIAEREHIDPRTVKKLYGIPKGVNGIDIYSLARVKCRLYSR